MTRFTERFGCAALTSGYVSLTRTVRITAVGIGNPVFAADGLRDIWTSTFAVLIATHEIVDACALSFASTQIAFPIRCAYVWSLVDRTITGKFTATAALINERFIARLARVRNDCTLISLCNIFHPWR